MHHPASASEVLLQRLRTLTQRETVSTVKRSNKSYLQEQGWLLTNGHSRPVWEGYYRSRYGSFKGRIELSLPPKYYIYNPPEPLRYHHWSCFTQASSSGWHSIHFSTVPKDASSGVLAIERLINDAFLIYQKTA
jgi:hypothetical protein